MVAALGELDPHSDRAPFRQIADQLRDFIRCRAPGTRLPSEAELLAHYRVARMTVRSAVHVLVQEGLVDSRQGAGTFVREPARRTVPAVRNLAHADDWMSERAEEAALVGLPLAEALQAVRDAYTSIEADRSIAEDP